MRYMITITMAKLST